MVEGKKLAPNLPSVDSVLIFLMHFNSVIFCYFSASNILLAIRFGHLVGYRIVYYGYSVLSNFLLALSGWANAPIMTCILDDLLN